MKSKEYREQARQFSYVIKVILTDRLFLWKIRKVINEKDFKLAMAKRKIKSLEAELEKVRATKRKKVEINLNMQFANIKTIRAA